MYRIFPFAISNATVLGNLPLYLISSHVTVLASPWHSMLCLAPQRIFLLSASKMATIQSLCRVVRTVLVKVGRRFFCSKRGSVIRRCAWCESIRWGSDEDATAKFIKLWLVILKSVGFFRFFDLLVVCSFLFSATVINMPTIWFPLQALLNTYGTQSHTTLGGNIEFRCCAVCLHVTRCGDSVGDCKNMIFQHMVKLRMSPRTTLGNRSELIKSFFCTAHNLDKRLP